MSFEYGPPASQTKPADLQACFPQRKREMLPLQCGPKSWPPRREGQLELLSDRSAASPAGEFKKRPKIETYSDLNPNRNRSLTLLVCPHLNLYSIPNMHIYIHLYF